MMSWSPGTRDRATDGLSVLARREQWRTSGYGKAIRELLAEALEDENPVVRMTATRALTAIRTDATSIARINELRGLLLKEPDRNVRLALLNVLSDEARESPREVDTLLRDLTLEARPTADPTDSDKQDHQADADSARRDQHLRLTSTLLTALALVHETPFASQCLSKWAANPRRHPELLHAIPYLRNFLTPSAEPTLQSRAFSFVLSSAEAALQELSGAQGQPEAALSQTDLAELKNALQVLDAIASQVYFASGAYDHRRPDTSAEPAKPSSDVELQRYVDLALPVLLACTGSTAAPVIHHVVETLVYLAPIDEKRVLTAVAQAVSASPGYAYDSLAAGAVNPYLTRLLAEERDLVLFDSDGVVAFRTLLTAFASAGNEAALVLAFTFADVFR